MVNMVAQPIVNIRDQSIVAEEWLCRPDQGTVQEYFQANSREELWEKERQCILEALKKQSTLPKSLNLTISSIPYFLTTHLTWPGMIEIVEWGPTSEIAHLCENVSRLQNRGLQVWVDDLTYRDWGQWQHVNVDGYKIILEEASSNMKWLQEVMKKGKRIVVECIETPDMEFHAQNMGISLAQGYYYIRKFTEEKQIVKNT